MVPFSDPYTPFLTHSHTLTLSHFHTHSLIYTCRRRFRSQSREPSEPPAASLRPSSNNNNNNNNNNQPLPRGAPTTSTTTTATAAKPSASSGTSTARSLEGLPGGGVGTGVDAMALEHLNRERKSVGLAPVDRLTVKLLKDQLSGQVGGCSYE